MNYDEVNRDDGSIITGLGAIGPTRYILKQRLIYEWTGNPETATPIRQVERPDASQNQARVAIGCYYSDTLVGWNNSLIFRAEDGDVYMLTQTELINLTKYYDEVRNLDSSCAAYVSGDYYIIGGSSGSYACYLPNESWDSIDDIKFNYALVRYNSDVLVPSGYIQEGEHEGDPDIWIPTINRLDVTSQDNASDFIKSFRTKYEKVGDNTKEAIIRDIEVYSNQNIAFTITAFNERGDGVIGTYDIANKRYTLTSPLRAKWVSVGVSWEVSTGVEIYGVNIGYIRVRSH